MATEQDVQTIERRTIAKVSWRLLPLVALAYCIAYIDRSNISFAALTMNKDLGFSAYIYGWGPAFSSSAISCSRFRAT
jgi:ACS family tartrate transporter-like MFS transporter